MNTISKAQKDELWELFTAYTATHKTPEDFWTIAEVTPSGDSVSDEEAAYIDVTVQDFDGRHDFDFVRRALLDVGVEVPPVKIHDRNPFTYACTTGMYRNHPARCNRQSLSVRSAGW